jgi:hypothetical protein
MSRAITVTAKDQIPFVHRSRAHEKPRVMFTGIEADEKDIKLIESLGGTHVTDISECTILVTNKVCSVYPTGSAPFMHARRAHADI